MALIKSDVYRNIKATSEFEFFTLFTTLDITANIDDTQKDFESIIQVIGLTAMPVLMNTPLELNGKDTNTLEYFGAPSLFGAGWILRFAFENSGVHTLDSLKNVLGGIVMNAGIIDTKTNINMEFSKQRTLYD